MKSCAITEKISRMSVLLLIVGVPDASVASGGQFAVSNLAHLP